MSTQFLTTSSITVPSRPLSTFVGRERELAAILDLVQRPDVRLLTLTGPGGVGKTRLALEAVHRLAGDGPALRAFVDAAPILDPTLVPSAIAAALGVRAPDGQPVQDVLVEALAGTNALVLLDNIEHLLDAAPQIAALLSACSGLTVLATSRERLAIDGEIVRLIRPLVVPDSGSNPCCDDVAASEAVALFAHRARAVVPGFAVTGENAGAVAHICQRLDGLPLAIELAAARADLFPPAAMLARLERGGGLPIPAGRGRPARQRTMHDAIDWSHDLLSFEDQAAFRRLGVFVGGISIDAAEAVVGAEALDRIASLVDKSLLAAIGSETGEARFGMLETVRAFALERLEAAGDTDVVTRAHATFFLHLAERAEAGLTGAGQRAWLERLETEHGNLRAALARTIEAGDADLGLRLAGALARFWTLRGHGEEARLWLERTLAASGDAATPARAKALHRLAVVHINDGDYGSAERVFRHSLAVAEGLGDRRGIADARTGLAIIAADHGDIEGARVLHTEALEIRRALGDRPAQALSLYNLGMIATAVGDFTSARAYLEETLSLREALGDDDGVAYATLGLGDAAAGQGDPAALPLLERALNLFRRAGDRSGTGYALLALARMAVAEGEHTEAAARYAEGLSLVLDLGERLAMVAGLEGVATVAVGRGQPALAARYLGAAAAAREALAIVRTPADSPITHRMLDDVRRALGEHAFAAAWAGGRITPLTEAAGEAVAWSTSAAKASPATPETDRAGLTPREWEVLRLLAEGRTDPEIAETLFMSPRTASWHVGRILTKLGAESRTAAVATAIRQGLL